MGTPGTISPGARTNPQVPLILETLPDAPVLIGCRVERGDALELAAPSIPMVGEEDAAVLRDPDNADKPVASREARPSLSRLSTLVEELSATGQPLDLTVTGAPTRISPSIDLSAFRVVQEALTNVMTHASGADTHVKVNYSDESLAVTITNDDSGTDTHAHRTTQTHMHPLATFPCFLAHSPNMKKLTSRKPRTNS